MGVHTWAYDPERCDGDYCPCNCDVCSKAQESDHIPIDVALQILQEIMEDEK